jgi:hypothetical protein
MNQATQAKPATTECCAECNKSYKNLKLHMVKTHKKVLCCSCEEWKPADTIIYNIGDEKKGKLCNAGMCDDCWT